MSRRAALLALVALVGAPSAGASINEWPMRGADPQRSGRVKGAFDTVFFGSFNNQTYALNAADGSLRWSADLKGRVLGSPVLDDVGHVLIGSEDGNLYALNARTGAARWGYTTSGKVPGSAAFAADSDAVYIGSSDGALYCVDRTDTTVRWRETTRGPIVHSAPLLGPDGVVYFGSHDTALRAQSPYGTALWTTSASEQSAHRVRSFSAINSSPALSSDGETVYVAQDLALYALDAAEGGVKFEAWFNATAAFSSPIVGDDGGVFVGTWASPFSEQRGALRKLDGATGAELWRFDVSGPTDEAEDAEAEDAAAGGPEGAGAAGPASARASSVNVSSTPALSQDGSTVFFGADDGRIFAVDAETGEERWSFRAGGPIVGGGAVGSNDELFIGSADGKLYALDGASGTLLWTFEAGDKVWSQPCLGFHRPPKRAEL
jgi:outer membrane protein assembly factor BamB